MKDNLIFIGMPASGKSTVGVVVAKRLGMNFVDTDLLIQQQEGMALHEIIAQKGKTTFLEIENQVNRDLQVHKTVISPGGSVIYCKEAMEHFKKIGTVVYLQASFGTIRKRIRSLAKRGVILEEGQTFFTLYEERTKLLEHYADLTVFVDGRKMEQTIENVLFKVKRYWRYLRKKEAKQAQKRAEKEKSLQNC